MPQVTVYVREEDLDQWKAIEKKAEFIHDALRSVSIPAYNKATEERAEIRKIIEPFVKNIGVSQAKEGQMKVVNAAIDLGGAIEQHKSSSEFVEVGAGLSGEFPCCDKAKPCQHWSFDGELWVNSLSGRKKEVA